MSDLFDKQSSLNNQLVRLGDMMGDGLHHEPCGKWIGREYKKVVRALGIIPTKNRGQRMAAIDDGMKRRVAEVRCGKCSGHLVQTRSGSKRAKCGSCGGLWQLLK